MQRKNNPIAQNFLSIIVPAYKQEKTIRNNIQSVEKALKLLAGKYEILVVVDGIVDKTYEEAKKIVSKNVKIIAYKKNQGKGHAIKQGVLQAKGDIIGFIDGGMDLQAKSIANLLDVMHRNDADVVVGSKLHPDSVVSYPWQRKILSAGYRSITRILFNLKVKDTQVGIKLFKRDVARDVFPRNLVKDFAFDVETLALAQRLGYSKIYEAPVNLDFKQSVSSITTANFWKVALRMFIDTLGIFYRLRIKKSYRK